MVNFFRRMYNGAHNVDGYGPHPGNGVMVMFVLIGAAFGIKQAIAMHQTTIGYLLLYVGVYVVGIVFLVAPIWIIGAYERGKSYEERMKIRENNHG